MLKLLLGDPNARKLKRYQPIVSDINLLEEEIAPLSDDQLREKTTSFQQRLANAGSLANQRPILDEILPEAFAVVREAGKRVLGMRHFDVQLIGGMVLHEGQIAEMKTGEGKTLVATLPSYLNALTGRGVHVVTVNDYLARRETLRAIVLVLDARRTKVSEDDIAAVDWVTHHGRILVPAITKCDLVPKNKRLNNVRQIEKQLEMPAGSAIVCSAKSGEGKRQLYSRLTEVCGL